MKPLLMLFLVLAVSNAAFAAEKCTVKLHGAGAKIAKINGQALSAPEESAQSEMTLFFQSEFNEIGKYAFRSGKLELDDGKVFVWKLDLTSYPNRDEARISLILVSGPAAYASHDEYPAPGTLLKGSFKVEQMLLSASPQVKDGQGSGVNVMIDCH